MTYNGCSSMEVVVSKMSMTGLSFGLIDLILNSVSEATPY